MKQKDKNIFIIIIFVIIFLFIWTLSRYNIAQKQSLESKQNIVQIQNDEDKTNDAIFTEEENPSIIPLITPDDLYKKLIIEENIIVVDTRTPEQFDKGHLKGSLHIDRLDTDLINSTIILINNNGNEDLLMTHYRDFSNTNTIYNLSGGFDAWLSENFNIISLNIEKSFENISKIQSVEPRDLDNVLKDEKQKKDIIILDVRRLGNYKNEHIPDAINISFNTLEHEYKKIPLTKNIYIYGTDEDQSFAAGVLLYDLGFIGVKTITGGFNAWKEYGYPITQ